ncbi:MAG: MMPL family transporter [Roseovarius indicus]
MPPDDMEDSGAHPLAKAIARWLVRYDLLAFLLGVGLIGLVALGLRNLELASDNRNFFGGDNPEIDAVLRLEDTYANADTVFFALVSEDSAFTPEMLEQLKAFTEDAWQLPYALRVESLANFSHSRAQGDEIIVEELIPPDLEIDAAAAERIGRIALASPELVNRLVSEDGRALGIHVNLALPNGQDGVVHDAAEQAREMKAAWQAAAPELDILLSGGIIGDLTFNEATKRDLFTLIPVAFVVVTLLMILGLGSVAGWLGTALITFSGTLATMGFAGWAGIELIPATATSPLAVMVLVAASCVHLVLSWTRRLNAGVAGDRAVQGAFEENLAAVAVANITTAAGFLCLNFSESPPLAEMGNIVAFGIIVGWLLTALILPAIMKRCPDFRFRPVRVPAAWLEALARGTQARAGTILIVFAALIAVAATGLSQIRFNDNPLRDFDESFEFRRDSDAIERHLTGMETVQFSLESPEGESVFSPEFLREADRFADWLRTQEKVVFVGSITDVLKRLNRTLGGDAPDAYRIADSQEANAQAMMLYELSLPPGQDMNQMLDIGRTKTRLIAVLEDASGQDIHRFALKAEGWMEANTPEIATKAVSVGVAFAELSRRNNTAMIWGMLTVLVLVSGILMLTLRDLKLGALSLVPNVLPALLGFGFWGWLNGDVNLGSTVVTTMTFGIVVDDTVHVLMHYQRALRTGLGREDALRDTFRKVGTALMVTSIAIMSGFVIMTQSGFAINKHIGSLSAVVVALALVTDLVLLPAVLKKARS